MHLEGSLSPELLFELAAKNNISLPQEDPAFASVEALYDRYERFSSLDDVGSSPPASRPLGSAPESALTVASQFLAYYYIGFTVLQHAADFESLAYTYFAKAHAQNVRHAEVFFDRQPHLARGIPLAVQIEGFARAQQRAEADFDLTTLLIPCLLRHLPAADSAAVFASLRDAGYFASDQLAGLGLCSTEIGQPPAHWAAIFDAARAAGVRRTVHAGEEGPAAYVTAALDELGAQRIDHGVRAAQDLAVVDRLAAQRVMLTVCPLSNVRLRGAARVHDVPIRLFLDKGVRFSINSDDPAYFGGYIQENYCLVQEAHELSIDEWQTIARNAVEGSWCGEKRKMEILREVESLMITWKGGVEAI